MVYQNLIIIHNNKQFEEYQICAHHLCLRIMSDVTVWLSNRSGKKPARNKVGSETGEGIMRRNLLAISIGGVMLRFVSAGSLQANSQPRLPHGGSALETGHA